MEFFWFCKMNQMLDFVSLPDFLSCAIHSVLNCCVALRHPAKTRFFAYLPKRAADCRIFDGAGGSARTHTHTLTGTEIHQLRCRWGAAMMHRVRIWWKLRVNLWPSACAKAIYSWGCKSSQDKQHQFLNQSPSASVWNSWTVLLWVWRAAAPGEGVAQSSSKAARR